MCTFGGVMSDVASVQPEAMCSVDGELHYDVADAEDLVESVVGFMQDDTQGMGAVYDLIGRRSDAVSSTRSGD